MRRGTTTIIDIEGGSVEMYNSPVVYISPHNDFIKVVSIPPPHVHFRD